MASSIESATSSIGEVKMTVARLMQESGQYRGLFEKLSLEVAATESGIRENQYSHSFG